MSIKSRYHLLAEAQGVARPFEILRRMSAEDRRLIADLLGCRLRSTDPDEQSWRIINQNLRGLQARTHSWPEKLSPLARNNNWWEIVTRSAHRVGVDFYPGLKDEEVERLLFDRLAEQFARQHLPVHPEVIDSVAEEHFGFLQALRSLRLSREATRTVLSAIVLSTVRADESIRESVQRLTQWLRGHRPMAWAASISAGLRMLSQASTQIFRAWITGGFVQRAGSNAARVCAAVAMIHFRDLLDRTLEEFETAGA